MNQRPLGARPSRRSRFAGLRLGASLALAGCVDNLAVCVDTTSDPAVTVQISDAVTGAPLAAGARGVIRDGAYADSLRPLAPYAGGRLLALGAGAGRPGRYDVVVIHTGYQPWERTGIDVGTNGCGLVGRRLRVDLEPTP